MSTPNLQHRKLQINDKRWLISAAGLVSSYVAICTLLWWQQQHLIFWPSHTLEHTPSLYNLRYQDVWLPIRTKNGGLERIHGWWIPAAEAKAPVMLYLHDNNMSAQYYRVVKQFITMVQQTANQKPS